MSRAAYIHEMPGDPFEAASAEFTFKATEITLWSALEVR